MAKMKDWIIDMEYHADEMMIHGMTDPDLIAEAVAGTFWPVDKEYVRKYASSILGATKEDF